MYCVVSIGLVVSYQQDGYCDSSGMYYICRTGTRAVLYQ